MSALDDLIFGYRNTFTGETSKQLAADVICELENLRADLAARREKGELARLHKIETAAKTMLAAWYEDDCKAPEILELRAVLTQHEKS